MVGSLTILQKLSQVWPNDFAPKMSILLYCKSSLPAGLFLWTKAQMTMVILVSDPSVSVNVSVALLGNLL